MGFERLGLAVWDKVPWSLEVNGIMFCAISSTALQWGWEGQALTTPGLKPQLTQEILG